MKNLYFDNMCWATAFNCDIKITSPTLVEIFKLHKKSFPRNSVTLNFTDDTVKIDFYVSEGFNDTLSDYSYYEHQHFVHIPEKKAEIVLALHDLFMQNKKTIFLDKLLENSTQILSEIKYASMNYSFSALGATENFLLEEIKRDANGKAISHTVFSEAEHDCEYENIDIVYRYLYDEERNIDSVTKKEILEERNIDSATKKETLEEENLIDKIAEQQKNYNDTTVSFYNRFVEELSINIKDAFNRIAVEDCKKKSLIIRVCLPTTKCRVVLQNDETTVRDFNTFPMTEEIWTMVNKFDIIKECIIESKRNKKDKINKTFYNDKKHPKELFKAFSFSHNPMDYTIEVLLK